MTTKTIALKANRLLRSGVCVAMLMVCCGARAASPLASDVVGVTLLTHDGGRVDWSPQNKIAFDRRGNDGYYQVWVMDADGGNQECLTCGAAGAPTRNKGNPAWYPTGEYIVFQGQKETMPAFLNHLAEPGRGVGNNLWLMTADGRKYWEIVNTDHGTAPAGVLHPHFSRDGTKLIWTQLVAAGGKLGQWALHVADFSMRDGEPVLMDEQALQPGPVKMFFESHGFSPDKSKILYTSQTPTGLDDEFVLDLAGGTIRNLTNSSDSWSEHAQMSPDGKHIVWATSRGIPGELRYLNLWIMNGDGTCPRQLADFHVAGTPFYTEGIGPGDSSWNPDGTKLAVYVIGDKAETKGDIDLIQLEPGFRNKECAP